MDFAANVFREQGRATRTRPGGVIRIYYLQCIEWNNKIYFLKEIVSCGSGCWTAGRVELPEGREDRGGRHQVAT
jgi:hypothetical protein